MLDLEAINDMPIDQRLPIMKALVEVGAVRISRATVGERRVKGFDMGKSVLAGST